MVQDDILDARDNRNGVILAEIKINRPAHCVGVYCLVVSGENRSEIFLIGFPDGDCQCIPVFQVYWANAGRMVSCLTCSSKLSSVGPG